MLYLVSEVDLSLFLMIQMVITALCNITAWTTLISPSLSGLCECHGLLSYTSTVRECMCRSTMLPSVPTAPTTNTALQESDATLQAIKQCVCVSVCVSLIYIFQVISLIEQKRRCCQRGREQGSSTVSWVQRHERTQTHTHSLLLK